MPKGTPDHAASASDRSLITDDRQSSPLPTRYVELARQTLSDAGGSRPTGSQFLLIVESALAAVHLLFTAALHEPAEWELDVAFETFVRACVLPSCSGGQR
jgi:hypothetical protein